MPKRKSPIVKMDLLDAAIVTLVYEKDQDVRIALRGTNSNKGATCTLNKLFKIEYDRETGQYDNSHSITNYRTLDRRVDKLIKNGIINKDENGLHLNLRKILNFGTLDKNLKEHIKEVLLDSEDYRNYGILRDQDDVYYNEYFDENDIEFLKPRVKNQCVRFKNNKDNIEKINAAIAKREEIEITYSSMKDSGLPGERRSAKRSVFPLCYVINRSGTKCYLFADVRRKIEVFDVEGISFSTENKNKSNRRRIDENIVANHIEKIQQLWDVGLSGEAEEIVLKILKDNEEGLEALDSLKKMGWTCEKEKNYYKVTGYVCGTSDFTKWLRSYSTSCFLLKPDYLKKRMIEALKAKINRYEELDL